MKKIITGVAAVAILSAGMISTSHAFPGLSLSGSYSKTSSTSQRSGRDSSTQGKNSAGRDRYEFKDSRRLDNSVKAGGDIAQDSFNRYSTSDNRQWNSSDSRNMSDNRQNTTIDSRDMSDRRITMDNRVDNTRNQSHNLGDNSIMISQGFNARFGHEKVEVGGVQGSNHMIDNSVNGNTIAIGNTSVAK